MTTLQQIVKNISSLFITRIITYSVSFIFTIIVARYFGDNNFGMYTLAMAYANILIIFTDLGLQQVFIREVARDKKMTASFLGHLIFIKIALVFLTAAAIIIILKVNHYNHETNVIIFLIFLNSVLLGSFETLFLNVFKGFEKMGFIAVLSIVFSSLLMVAALVVIRLNMGIKGLVYMMIAINLLKLIVVLFIIFIKEGLPFAFSEVFCVIFVYIDSIMLSIMKNIQVVGWYNASYKLIIALTFIPISLFGALYPVMSRLYIQNKDKLTMTINKSIKYLIVLSTPIAVGTTLLADKIILIIYGPNYIKASDALQILIWANLISNINWAYSVLLNSINKQGIFTLMSFICSIFNIGVNLFLIPRYGMIGAGIATVGTEMLLGILSYHFIGKHFIKIDILKYFIKPFLASLIMGIIIWSFSNLHVGLTILIGASVYIACIFLMRTFDNEDRGVFKILFPIRQL
jgi:O-antigen/teichoic acid export membrane protein